MNEELWKKDVFGDSPMKDLIRGTMIIADAEKIQYRISRRLIILKIKII